MTRGLKGSADRVVAGAPIVQAAVGDIAHGLDLRRAAELDDVESESSAYCRAANGALGRSVHGAEQKAAISDSEVVERAEPPQEILVPIA